VLLTPGYAGLHVACREINDATATPRRALILGSVIWLAKQMNLIEFMAAADDLSYERQIELWVVSNVTDRRRTRTIFARPVSSVSSRISSRFSRSVRIVAERTGGGFKLKNARLYFQSSAYCRDKG
jgi:polysaccharide biosynthesis protein PslH